MTNRIVVKELWDDDPTGQYCSEIMIDGRHAASCYSRDIETILLGSLRDSHTTIERDVSRVKRQRGRG